MKTRCLQATLENRVMFMMQLVTEHFRGFVLLCVSVVLNRYQIGPPQLMMIFNISGATRAYPFSSSPSSIQFIQMWHACRITTGQSLGDTQTPEYPCTVSCRCTARDPAAFWTANVSVYKEYKETNLLRHDRGYFKLISVCSELSNLSLNFYC